MLQGERTAQARDIVGLERAEARIGKDRRNKRTKAAAGEVLVSECERHVRIEDRVVAIGFDDEGGSVGLEHAAILGQCAFGQLHVMQRVLRVHEVERGVGEGKLLGIRDGEGEARLLLPGSRRFHVDRDDLVHTLTQEARDTTVTAARVEERFVAAERVPELVDATDPVPELAVCGHSIPACGIHGPKSQRISSPCPVGSEAIGTSRRRASAPWACLWASYPR